jgi:hypothetical protein
MNEMLDLIDLRFGRVLQATSQEFSGGVVVDVIEMASNSRHDSGKPGRRFLLMYFW